MARFIGKRTSCYILAYGRTGDEPGRMASRDPINNLQYQNARRHRPVIRARRHVTDLPLPGIQYRQFHTINHESDGSVESAIVGRASDDILTIVLNSLQGCI